MSKALDIRLNDAKATLAQIDAALGRHPNGLPTDVTTKVQELVAYRGDIDHLLGLIEARSVARTFLDSLETRADATDFVSLGSARAKYQYVRLIGAQGYLATNWALGDNLTGFVGRVLCIPEVALNMASPAQLISHFIQKDRTKKSSAAMLFETIRQSFGWPIGLSYAIRNHFMHEGAQLAGVDFFDGPTAASAFRISVDGWDRIVKKVETYSVERSFHRLGATWLASPRDDLRVLLAVCEREMDEALGILLGSACQSLCAHVGFMVGED